MSEYYHNLSKALAKATAYRIHYNKGDNAFDILNAQRAIILSGLTKDEAESKYKELTR